ncbi:MAG: 16S rRNA (adenine(1518)-N(6)/adenine(1519)-N(6))-dimethyltransferase RsmA [Candidatus Aminicenantes bacterium]|nr:16S rRNA (adenine(1518)-N(6)/adenine(1519)-N(6))-dimethyltransferase RsmA [Candidatus Aminicenantes bacterium]
MKRTKRQLLGQHFLKNPRVLDRIAAAIAPGPEDLILEIGPGTGALTARLCGKAGRVVAVEKDPALVRRLTELGLPGLTLVEGDALALDWKPLLASAPSRWTVKIAGNLPYSISTPLLFKVLDLRARFAEGVFLIQKEVAERLAARPGRKAFAPLSILFQLHFEVRLLFKVAPGSFAPPPKVDSALISHRPRPAPLYALEDEPGFRALLRVVFEQRRKTLFNGLLRYGTPAEKAARALEALALPKTARPEELSIEHWVRLFGLIKKTC